MNKKRALAVYRDIKKHWKNYDQSVYHEHNPEVGECLSTHCVAGFCELRAKGIKKRDNIAEDEVEMMNPIRTHEIGRQYLNITYAQAQYLFGGGTPWKTISRILQTGKFPKWLEGK